MMQDLSDAASPEAIIKPFMPHLRAASSPNTSAAAATSPAADSNHMILSTTQIASSNLDSSSDSKVLQDDGTQPAECSPNLPEEFAATVQSMPPCVRALLVDNAEPSTVPVDDLLAALNKHSSATRKAASGGGVLQIDAALSAAACSALRRAVDAERSVLADTVDQGPEHQLSLDREGLERLIGKDEALRTFRLPLVYRRWRRAAYGEADPNAISDSVTTAEAENEALTLQEAFIRRYSPETRPILKFHADAYELTVNIALSPDAGHTGGRLIGLFEGEVRALVRGEGSATVHSSSLLHAVSRMTSGVRYSLICFFDRKPGRYDPTRYEKRWAPSKDANAARWWE